MIEQLKFDRAERVQFDSDALLARLREQADADLADIFDSNQALKPIHDWPLVWRGGLIRAIDTQEVFERDENGKKIVVGRVVKIKFSDRLRVLELIGKHVKVKAFDSRGEQDTVDAIDEFLADVMGNSIRPKVN